MPRAAHRAIRIFLVLVLSIGVNVQSSRAMLPEIVVGGTVLFQVVEVLGELLPQLTTLGTSLMGLASAGQEATSTLGRLFQQIFPRKQAAARKDIGPINVPVISGPTDAPEAPPAGEDVPAPDGELDGKLSQLVTAYRNRLQPSSVSFRGSAPRASMTRGEQSYETLADQTTETLIETVRGGDKKSLEKFMAAVKRLDPEDRPAVTPVLQKAVKGARFSRIHGDSQGAAGFAKLKSLNESLR